MQTCHREHQHLEPAVPRQQQHPRWLQLVEGLGDGREEGALLPAALARVRELVRQLARVLELRRRSVEGGARGVRELLAGACSQ